MPITHPLIRTTATCTACVALFVVAAQPAESQGTARPSFAEPSLSPDGREVVFTSGGDIWSVSAGGGEARLLVSHAAHESRPMLSPDGERLAFVSTRSGNGDVYVVTLSTGELLRVTHDDLPDQLDGWSRDGRSLYFTSASRDIAGMPDVWRVSSQGGTPVQVAADRYTSEYWASESPDAGTLAITARGITSGQWWRHGSSHIDQSEIWLVRNVAPGRDGAPEYSPLVAGGARHAWPMWSADGRTVFFTSDRGGRENLWSVPASGGEPRQLTRFTGGRVLWPAIAHDGRSIVFEREFGIWQVDVSSGAAREIPITLRGSSAAASTERLSLSNGFQELAVAPDGRKVAFIVRGELFAGASRDGAEAARITRTAGAEASPAWSPDSRRLVYVSDREAGATGFDIYLHDFGTGRETRLTDARGDDVAPLFSHDGRRIAYVHDGTELRVMDVSTRATRTIARAVFGRPPFDADRVIAWSPDDKWVAYYAPTGGRNFGNVFIAPAAGGESRQVSWLSNVFGGSISWSRDGTYLLVTSAQRTEPAQVVRIDLVPRTPSFREDQFRELFQPGDTRTRQEQPQPGQPRPDSARRATDTTARGDSTPARAGRTRDVRIVFDDIRKRMSYLPIGLSADDAVIGPDGKQLALVATVAGQTNIYLWPLDELARERVAKQVTSTPGYKSSVQWSPDGKELYFLEGGRINAVTVESRAVRQVAATAEMDAEFTREKPVIFAQVWRFLRDNFYDEGMHGVDWNAQRDRFAPRLAAARTPDEMRRLLSLMVGELNASHLGIGGPPAQQPYTGKLGIRWNRAALERDGRLVVSEILPLGPVDVAGGVAVGDALVAVDGQPLGERTNLDELLSFRTGRRTELTIRKASGGASRTVAVQPVTTAAEKQLLYRQWVEGRREYVARASGGRLGYVHIIDMGLPSLNQLFLDLDAEQHDREGVVIDIRNNNGGFVHAYALDVFTRRPYLTMQSRGYPRVPARTQLGQRALERPTILVTNQHSLSDAEDFTEGYRAMGLGKVVGEPTAGWIVYTSNVTLLDGTTMRIPFQRIRGVDGADMERVPRPVDVPVKRPVGESYSPRDVQLDTAVRELLAGLGRREQ